MNGLSLSFPGGLPPRGFPHKGNHRHITNDFGAYDKREFFGIQPDSTIRPFSNAAPVRSQPSHFDYFKVEVEPGLE